MKIRSIQPTDENEWVRMRNLLWTEETDEHRQEVQRFFAGGKIDVVTAFVLEREDGSLAGFIELNLRDYAEGYTAAPVPYIEGWYVDEDVRGQGYGGQLVQAAEAWALTNGFHELASDAELENTDSIAAHKALGFSEVERIVCFIKTLA